VRLGCLCVVGGNRALEAFLVDSVACVYFGGEAQQSDGRPPQPGAARSAAKLVCGTHKNMSIGIDTSLMLRGINKKGPGSGGTLARPYR
jgi:hypothetical protein